MESKIAGSFFNWLETRQSKTSHRQLLVLSGSNNWSQATAELAIRKSNFAKILWAGDREAGDSKPIDQYKHYLGQEFNAIVYNAHSGIRANALMALSGSVSSKGLMILLCPDFSNWPHLEDPEAKNKTSYGHSLKPSNSYFIHWLIARLQDDEYVTIVTEELYYPANKQAWAENTSITYEQQQEAIVAIQKTACGRNKRPLVITADRGRGKTSALGIASAELFQQGFKKIIITAPNFNTVAIAFKHAHKLLKHSSYNNQTLLYKDSRLDFCAPDDLLEGKHNHEVVFVDEAAAIPTDMLKNICKQYPKVVFSTTIHGYEGSGRGFELRFKQFLNERFPAWKNVHLNQPIRWFQGDVLESFWFKTMLMNSDLHIANPLKSDETHIKFRKITKSELLDSPSLLSEIFTLLINAHYQTSPDDLNRLLDAQEQDIYAAFNHSVVVAVILASHEGGEHISSLAKDISSGKRRVQGHLVAQSILYLTGSIDYAHNNYLRIVRIAVAKDQQRKGYATDLLNFVKEDAKRQKIDYLCVSYGLNLSLLLFWLNNHYKPVKLGTKRDAASGEHSIVMLEPLTKSATLALQALRLQFHQDLTYQASRNFKRLSPKLLSALLRLDKGQSLSSPHLNMLQQIQEKNRRWDSCESTLKQLVLSVPDIRTVKALEAHALLIALFIQNCDQLTLQKELKLTGKKQLSEKIVDAVNLLLPLQ